ncbi:MAG: c-type cytochrome [Bacteroidetes bacterium]|nr:c-type cytochrome [Bacteroidota bacterium]MBU2508454.1 c-type cytochrome [Bacteroidota bacterium]
MKLNRLLVSFVIMLTGFNTALAEGSSSDETIYSVAKYMTVITLVFILIVLWLVIVYSEKNDRTGQLFLAPLKKLISLISQSTPIENESEILLAHEYDGIRELDNKIPPWFHGLLWGTVIISIIYMIQYHVIGTGNVQEEEYLAEVTLASVERDILIRTGAFINEETVTVTNDAAALKSGEDIFVKNCAACHGMKGEGLVGPNFADEYWVHGGGIKNIFKVIKYGVPQKGMISWQTQLDPKQIQEVSSYILSLRGTNPPNPKAPEGELWVDAIN